MLGIKVVQHGKGIQVWADGSTYNGEWFEGLQHGYGGQKWLDVDS